MDLIKEVRDKNCPGAPLPKVRAKRSNKKKVVEEEEMTEDEEDDEQEEEQPGPSGHQAHSPPETVQVQEDEEEEEDKVVTTPRQEAINNLLKEVKKVQREQCDRMKKLRAQLLKRVRDELTLAEEANKKALDGLLQKLQEMKKLP
ncbi:actin-binding protein-like [Bufo bufo]|uniref:actin-binding protein-like n=1 Tax=Bufo bufo TaxID=8384 RepID=UPI001ABDA636|nr:actin-binding protein-like [Bufo bufo]